MRSQEIGERVMKLLRELDEVAYVRFASVYRCFRDIDEFRAELEKMARAREASARPVVSVEADGRLISRPRTTSGWACALERGARRDALAEPARRRGRS